MQRSHSGVFSGFLVVVEAIKAIAAGGGCCHRAFPEIAVMSVEAREIVRECEAFNVRYSPWAL